MKTETQNLFRVAIVGAASLKGKELKDVLEERNFPAAEIKLLDDDESLGQLERVQDEVAVVQPVGRDELAQMDFTFFASDEDFTRKKWKLAREAGSAIVDMSYALENEPGVPVSAPWIERELGELTQFTLESSSIVMAHPAAVALALLLLRATQSRDQSAIALPRSLSRYLSEAAQGMDELHEQTVNLLSFQQLPTAFLIRKLRSTCWTVMAALLPDRWRPRNAASPRICASCWASMRRCLPWRWYKRRFFTRILFPSTLRWPAPWPLAISLAALWVSMCRLRARQKILPAT